MRGEGGREGGMRRKVMLKTRNITMKDFWGCVDEVDQILNPSLRISEQIFESLY